jgi:hypothetical protein
VVQFDLSKYKFVEEMQVAARLDSRPDLLALKPAEFEHLIRELFEAVGMKSWVTQASRDERVDGVAVNEDPVVGGLCAVQAKRYSKIVGLEAVHALAGVMDDKHAAKVSSSPPRGSARQAETSLPATAASRSSRDASLIHAAGTPRPRRPHQPAHPST